MNRALLSLLSIIMVTTILSDCSCKHLCSKAMPLLWFKNFDSVDLNTIKLSMYARNGQFDQLQEVQYYTSKNLYTADTMQMYANKIYLQSPTSYDYIVEVPAAGRSWRIAAIDLKDDRLDVSTCVSGMTYYQNDTLHTLGVSFVNTDTTSAIVLYR